MYKITGIPATMKKGELQKWFGWPWDTMQTFPYNFNSKIDIVVDLEIGKAVSLLGWLSNLGSSSKLPHG